MLPFAKNCVESKNVPYTDNTVNKIFQAIDNNGATIHTYYFQEDDEGTKLESPDSVFQVVEKYKHCSRAAEGFSSWTTQQKPLDASTE